MQNYSVRRQLKRDFHSSSLTRSVLLGLFSSILLMELSIMAELARWRAVKCGRGIGV